MYGYTNHSLVYPSEYGIKKWVKSRKTVLRAVIMRREQTKQTFKLRMLALVLALALLWYSINPAPSPVKRYKPEDEPPNQKKRDLEPQLQRADPRSTAFETFEMAGRGTPASNEDEGDFEWPEFIDG
jgi:hypothetical protein